MDGQYPQVGVLPAANQMYQNPMPGFFPGPMVAGLNPYQLQGMQGTYDALAQGAQSFAPAALDFMNRGYGGLMDYVEGAGEINPYLDQMADAYTQAAGRALDRMIPGQELNQVMAGGMGSDRHGIAEGLLRSDANAQLQEQLARLYGQGYENAAGRALQGWGMVPGALNQGMAGYGSLMDMMTAPSQYMSQAGNFLQTQAQNQLAGEQQRWNYLQQQPWNRLQDYSGLVMGSQGGASSGTQTNPGYLGPFGGAAAGLASIPAGVWGNAFGPGSTMANSGLGGSAGSGWFG